MIVTLACCSHNQEMPSRLGSQMAGLRTNVLQVAKQQLGDQRGQGGGSTSLEIEDVAAQLVAVPQRWCSGEKASLA